MKYRLESIWLILVLLTVFAFFLGTLPHIQTLFIAVLFLSTFLKGLLISEHFMALQGVRYRYRLIPILWLLLVLGVVWLNIN